MRLLSLLRCFARAPSTALIATGFLFASAPRAVAQTGCGIGEWVCHKTADGLHPDGNEQALLWLMNRARQSPAAEGAFLAGLDDPAITAAIDFYAVDLGVMQDEFDAIVSKPPAAFDRRIYEAARAHAQLMIDENDDNPDCGSSPLPPCQLDRVGPAGFFFLASGLRGNAFGFAATPLYAHAAWDIDWGPFPPVPPGMVPGRVHRKGVMSDPDATADRVLTNVGLAAVDTTGTGSDLGPLVVVADYARANPGGPDHYNRFLVGTVWQDLDLDGLYDPGEGKGGVTVSTDTAAWTAMTAPGGGYAIPILDPGPLEVTFTGGGVASFETTLQVGTESVLVDYLVPEPSAVASALVALAALGSLRRGLGRAALRS